MNNGMNRIMVVDDDEMLVMTLEFALRTKGYMVVSAFSGAEALEKLRADRHDLVLLDIMMPGLNGWETLREIKGDKELASVPVIMCSAKPLSADKLSRKDELGFEDFVPKPFGLGDMYSSVRRALES